jgi:AcrR family transcriptional regulator
VSSHLARGVREQHVLDVACRLLESHPIHEITFTQLAQESGVSRAWVYTFFYDLESIYLRLFEGAFPEYIYAPLTALEFGDDVVTAWRSRAERQLDMPAGIAILGSDAMMAGGRARGASHLVRNLILETLDWCWVDPMTQLGADRAAVSSGVLAYTHSLFGLVVAVHHGQTTRPAAVACLSLMAGAIADTMPSGVTRLSPPRPAE